MGMRGGLIASGKAKETTLSAVVTRADGTVENLGVVTYWHRNPLRRWLWNFRHWRDQRKGRITNA